MKPRHTTTLSKQEQNAVQMLLERCRQAEGLTLSFPFEECTSFYLLFETEETNPTLSAVLGLILPDASEEASDPFEERAECLALTDPSRRQQGYFRTLLAAAEPEFEDYDLLFWTDGQSRGARETLRALEAELCSEEYRMEYPLSETPDTKAPLPFPFFLRETEEEEQTHHYECFASPDQTAVPIARYRTRAFGTQVCFYDFFVREDARGQGIGKQVLLRMLSLLRDRAYSKVFLHVSGDNLPAVSLYQKTGFRIRETLSLFLY